jgi:hypothetical protein
MLQMSQALEQMKLQQSQISDLQTQLELRD